MMSYRFAATAHPHPTTPGCGRARRATNRIHKLLVLLVVAALVPSCLDEPEREAEKRDAGASDAGREAGRDAGGGGPSQDRMPLQPAEDAGAEDDKTRDASANGGCEPFVMPEDCTIPEGAVLPGELRCTGLYDDSETRELACGVKEYRPSHVLWSDDADKTRYVWLPPGETVDVSDPDDFVYPVGTQFWKEFRVGEDGAKRLGETRLMRKTDRGWLYTTYVWNEDGTNAVQVNEGVEDLFGTGHTVPTRDQCRDCHVGRPDFILGWDFLMLGEGAQGVTRKSLAEEGWLSGLDDEQAMLSAQIPGDDVERAALGYLHANCGVSCHNETSQAPGRLSGLWLRLEAGELESVHTTDAVTSGINRSPGSNVALQGLTEPPEGFYDFRPLDPERSLAIAKMNIRGVPETPMPPIGSNIVHDEGVALVTEWINHMTQARGYPEPAP